MNPYVLLINRYSATYLWPQYSLQRVGPFQRESQGYAKAHSAVLSRSSRPLWWLLSGISFECLMVYTGATNAWSMFELLLFSYFVISATCLVCPRSCAPNLWVASVITGRWSGAVSSLSELPTRASAAKARTRTASSATTTDPGASCAPTPDTQPGTTKQIKILQACPGLHGLACISIMLAILCPFMPSQKTWSSSTSSRPSSPSLYMLGLESVLLYCCAHRRRSHSCAHENWVTLKQLAFPVRFFLKPSHKSHRVIQTKQNLKSFICQFS